MLEALEVQQSRFWEVIQVAAAALVKATHLLQLCRHKHSHTQEKVSSLYQCCECAKEKWGLAPPPNLV